jgi:L-threonate 2-dehydrogenase
MKKVGVIGLGVMGLAMAQNLIRSGFNVHGYDIDAMQTKKFKAVQGVVCRSVQDLTANVDVLITSLPSANALMTVCRALAETEPRKLIVIETSTLPIREKKAARRLLSPARMVMLDCPLSGTGSQAQTKDLVVYASGPNAAFKQVRDVLDGVSRAQFYLGAFGNGMKLKMVANYLVAIHNAATAEALILAERVHLNLELVLAAIGDSAGQSKMWQVRGPRMAAEDYSPMMSMHLWQKDMGIISEFVSEAGAPSPVFDQARAIYALAYEAGYGDSDSAVIHRFLKSLPRGAIEAKPVS